MTTTMLGAGHKNVTIFHETIGHTAVLGLCCLVLMRSCCRAVIRSCSNTAEDYATHALSFLIISHEKVIQWKNVEHTFKNHNFAKFLLNG